MVLAALGSVAHSVDKKVSQSCFRIEDLAEGRLDVEFLAEGKPVPKGGGLGGSVLGRVGRGGKVKRKPEISFE